MAADILTLVSPDVHPLTGFHRDVLLTVLNNFEPHLATRRLLSNGHKFTILLATFIVCALFARAPHPHPH